MSIDQIFSRMQSETVNGTTLSDLVGGGPPREVGESLVDFLQGQELLHPQSRIFEIGCGCGRAALMLAERLGTGTRYVGVDIIPDLVRFCRREIASLYPNFEFYAAEGNNPQYDSYITKGRESLFMSDLDQLEGSRDLVLAFSVFTHLREVEARDMLNDVWKKLAVGGTAVLSFFLLDEVSRRVVRSRKTNLFEDNIDHIDKGIAIDSSIGANSAVGYSQELLQDMILASGFEGIRAIHYGSWRFSSSDQFQDIVILQKETPIPDDFDPEGYLRLNPGLKQGGLNPFQHFRKWGTHEGRKWR